MSFSRRKNQDCVGLDIDGDFVAAVAVNGRTVVQAASADLAPGALKDGEVADAGALTSALKHLFHDNGLPKRVLLGLAGQQITVRRIQLPQIEDKDDREAAIRFKAEDAIPMPLEDCVLDHQLVGVTTGPEGPMTEVVVVAARRTMIQAVVEAVRAAGLRPEGIDLNAFALVRTLGVDGVEPDHVRVLCHLGGVTNLAIATGAFCPFTRTLASRSGIDGVMDADSLADEVRLSIDYYMAQPNARRVAEIVLSGPGARDDALAQALTAQLGLPVSVAEPLGMLDTSAIVGSEDPHRHTIAAGLALGAAA